MQPLTPEGQQTIHQLAQQHGFSPDAVMAMLQSLLAGHGTMAQFNHPEFGGTGQWMQSGMIMLSDMFNQALKAKVDGLCHALSTLLSQQPDMLRPRSTQMQHQGQQPASPMGGSPQPRHPGPSGPTSLFVSPSEGATRSWWPVDLEKPTAVGTQNHIRYAYFREPRRLAIEINGQVTVYDTLDHQISGFSQQQAGGSSLTFTSQHGVVSLAALPVLTYPVEHQPQEEEQVAPPEDKGTLWPVPSSASAESPQGRAEADEIFTVIERLAELKAKGLLTEEEFTAKKAELLRRL
jgi:hypothetical protein